MLKIVWQCQWHILLHEIIGEQLKEKSCYVEHTTCTKTKHSVGHCFVMLYIYKYTIIETSFSEIFAYKIFF